MNNVDLDEGHKMFRLKMKQIENFVIKLTDEELQYLTLVVGNELEERERQLQ